MSNYINPRQKPGNKYVNNYGWEPRQRLAEDLIIQAIKRYGLFLRYIPREVFERDPLFGDDTFSKFEYAFEIEAYVKDVESYSGQNDIFAGFGYEVKDQITFTISRRRWKESNEHKILDETNLPIEDESSETWDPYNTQPITEENGPGGDYLVASSIPKAGDIIYFPLVDKLFEITFVEHENLFYQFGTLLTYDLKCELFRYSNEEFETGDDDIDAFNSLLSTDQMDLGIGDEDNANTFIESESGEYVVEENDVLSDKDGQSNNDYLQDEGDDLIVYEDFHALTKRKF